ncbi:beta-phosphoglucomutase family hydrolase [Salinimonas marina]|uniref:Beta-phosphoglucomutase family hydrolase n=1 Tax=Salinimonas marina TaxID=2785918 RepID=A0A7S9DXS9_9ALTE|nr:beta-phosphoglucomutase family hydrolase [Salinimonas marina]QPG05820.1 beta-phosphoglucomutase family hydrolase [Salinimonas marina]
MKVDLSGYRGIVFDMDGTLLDSMGSHLQAWQQTCEHYGYPFDRAFLHNLGGVPSIATVEILNDKHGLTHAPAEVARYKRDAWMALDHSPTLIEDTMAVFEYYRPTMKIGIGTGADRAQAEKLLAQHGLLARIDALVTSSDVTQGKPHPQTFLNVAKHMGVAPEQCVVFEDTEIGEQAARRAQMDCILVHNGVIQVPDSQG